MWNEDHSAANNVHSLTVNSEFINQSKVESPVSKLKKIELKSYSWAASVSDRIRRRMNILNKPAVKGMLYTVIDITTIYELIIR